MNAAAGVLLVHKPMGLTSHDVVEVVRRRLGVQRVGHTGTLDPMAEGLLVLLVGAATKHQHALQTHDKTYEATVRLGTQTETGDAEGAPIRTAPVPPLERGRIEDVLRAFTGPLTQTPPAYSAVKVGGRPAYWWARQRKPVTLEPRTVHILQLTLLEWTPETLTLLAACSSGTYIRSLGEAIAERLGTVGHLIRLVRRRVGQWSLQDAKPLSWVAGASPEALTRELRPLPAAPAAASRRVPER
jgi:tRNA pseudouridine55 synthase